MFAFSGRRRTWTVLVDKQLTEVRWYVGYNVRRRYTTISGQSIAGVATYMGKRVLRQWYEVGDHRLSVQDKLIEDAYCADPSAFWNRPDGDYLNPEPYRPTVRVYDATADMTMFLELEQ